MVALPAPNAFPARHPSIEFLDTFLGEEAWPLVAIRRSDRDVKALTFTSPTKGTAPEWITRWNKARYEIYFAINPLKHQQSKKATKVDVASAGWLWADIDPPATLTGADLDAWRYDKRMEFEGPLPGGLPEPTYLNDSGRGYWLLWRLRSPAPVDGKDGPLTAKIEAHGRAIEGLFAPWADHCSNIDRVARLPGTINHKTGQVASVLTVSDCAYELADFPAPIAAPAAPPQKATMVADAAAEPADLPGWLRDKIETDDVPVGTRSEHFHSVVTSLAELRWSHDAIERAIASRSWSTGKYGKRLRENIERSASKAGPAVVTPANDDRISPAIKPADPLDAITLGRGVDWTRPAGLLATTADWILETSPWPNRPLAVAAAASVLSTVCGRFLYGPTGSAMNIYVACLAETGDGKDRAFSAVAEILRACGLGKLQTTAKSFSISGYESMMVDSPCCCASADEMGANLLARISNKNANSHESAMKPFLQELWSRVRGKAPFLTTRRATSAPVEVHSPALTIFGASTPGQFYAALTHANVEDGFMNRFLLAPGAARADKRNRVELTPVPQIIVDTVEGIIPDLDGKLSGLLGVFSLNAKFEERQLEWAGQDVEDAAEAFEHAILKAKDAKPPAYQLLTRVFEYSVRLASIHAVSRAGADAVVTMDDLHWGAAWALASARTMMEQAGTMMARNDHESDLNLVTAAIKEAKTISQRDLLRHRDVRHIQARDLAGIIDQLKLSEMITAQKAGRQTLEFHWIAS